MNAKRLVSATALAVPVVLVIGYQTMVHTQQRGATPPAAPPAVPPIAIDATEAQIKQAVGGARVGRKLTPKTWPNNARVAVAISFDIDNELLSRNAPLPVPLSQGEYGATTALPRILQMAERQQIPITFFVPAVSAMLHPDMIPSIMKANRHEIAVHGWIHENNAALNDAEAFIEGDLDFHLALAEATQNDIIPILIDSIIDLLREQRKRIFLTQGGAQRGQIHHKRILKAVKQHDPDAARKAMRAHLKQVRHDSQSSPAVH